MRLYLHLGTDFNGEVASASTVLLKCSVDTGYWKIGFVVILTSTEA